MNSHLTHILEEVKKYIKDDSFLVKESGSISSTNYYGIYVALKAGYNFQNVDVWVNKIISRQTEDGGFGNAEATAHAVLSLYLLQSKNERINYLDK